MPTIDITNEEIAKLVNSTDDDIRKQELLVHLDGQETTDIKIKTLTVLEDGRANVLVSICRCKSGQCISSVDETTTLSQENIDALFNLIKTFDTVTSLVQA
jgi:uncharacterized protein (DUF39 family)